ncbi:MAG: CotH kinase family protein, partial [Bacteroidota bacterium]|nr:CotH kinase family protein [Bacteroidota bacterium]
GKNTFLIKSAQTGKFVIIPWDLDATWGLFWDGTYTEPTFITTNYLYDRLFELNPNDFKTKLKNRWFALRQNVFSQEEILLEFEKPLSLILKSGIIEKENLIWKLNINTEAEYNYIKTWISARLNYLDNYFSNLS